MRHGQEMAWYAQQRDGAKQRKPPPGDPAQQLLVEASELYNARQFAQSEALFQRLTLAPLFADRGHFGLGLVALAQGQRAAAAGHLQRALQVNPGYANAHFYLGEIREQEGDMAAALQHYRQALSNDPSHAGARKAMSRSAGTAESLAPPAMSVSTGAQGPGGQPGVAAVSTDLGVYEYLRSDTTLLARQTVAKLEELKLRRRAPLSAWLGPILLRAAVLFALIVAETIVKLSVASDVNDDIVWILAGLYLLVFTIRATTTVYDISGGRLTVERGVLWRRNRQVELWRVQGIDLRKGLLDRITGHGELRFSLVSPQARLEKVRGLARGQALRDLRQSLLDLVFLLRSNPVVKGIIS